MINLNARLLRYGWCGSDYSRIIDHLRPQSANVLSQQRLGASYFPNTGDTLGVQNEIRSVRDRRDPSTTQRSGGRSDRRSTRLRSVARLLPRTRRWHSGCQVISSDGPRSTCSNLSPTARARSRWGDRGCDAGDFVEELRTQNVAPAHSAEYPLAPLRH